MTINTKQDSKVEVDGQGQRHPQGQRRCAGACHRSTHRPSSPPNTWPSWGLLVQILGLLLCLPLRLALHGQVQPPAWQLHLVMCLLATSRTEFVLCCVLFLFLFLLPEHMRVLPLHCLHTCHMWFVVCVGCVTFSSVHTAQQTTLGQPTLLGAQPPQTTHGRKKPDQHDLPQHTHDTTHTQQATQPTTQSATQPTTPTSNMLINRKIKQHQFITTCMLWICCVLLCC